MARIKTRILIISDTHGHTPASSRASADLSPTSDFAVAVTGYRLPLPAADVVLHCGDLTTRSTPPELSRTLNMLRGLRAPLKIIIPGNHDRLLDAAFWHDDAGGYNDPEYHTEALELLRAAEEDDGIVYIGGHSEGAHTFPLANGAVLRLYASPWTPEYGVWGFQYRPEDGHAFDIPAGIDIAMTHGPPRDVLDLAGFALPQFNMQPTPAGCPDLFAAVARARPRVHCFGHIHEAWGAYLARWKTGDHAPGPATAEQAIDAARSRSIVALADIKPMTHLHPPATPAQVEQLMDWSAKMGVSIDWEKETGAADEDGRVGGEHTLFVNAAIEGYRQEPSQLPFIVDMLLDEVPPSSS
ncbi:Metallophosphoesterase [Cordyceps militaris CM01]|uniref:Metallophosphoesterase n=2 Tax=Cordyceps militaris TaxID=73501 RepID=G3JA22_CORMM|nr:Metallophosphoesterase [Cordyceps militaris CM01]ATY61226.1 Metallophosphoesterase [Cordyceps militaris]EGX95042.1 Metallophosphoesterase [Cordyceps militaris CM01]